MNLAFPLSWSAQHDYGGFFGDVLSVIICLYFDGKTSWRLALILTFGFATRFFQKVSYSRLDNPTQHKGNQKDEK